MEIAKSLLQVRNHEGYVGRDDHKVCFLLFIFVKLQIILILKKV